MPCNQRDEIGLAKLRKALVTKPLTIQDIMGASSISRKSAYRWLNYLRESGADIVIRKDLSGFMTYSVLDSRRPAS